MKNYQPGRPCPNNGAVVCPNQTKCKKCGWDPQVSERRKMQHIAGKGKGVNHEQKEK